MCENAEECFDDIRDSFEEEHLQESLERVVNILGISSPKYRVKSGSKVGDNYVGVLYRVFIEGEKNGVQVKIQTIFKVPPKDDELRQQLQVEYLFSREHTIYSEIVPVFKEFLKTKNKTLENFPECYLSSDECKKEVICLEDLRQKGFTMKNPTKFINFAHASLAFRALGRFHAISFALRDQRPDIFHSKIATLKEPLFRSDLVTQSTFTTRMAEVGDLVKTALAEDDPKYTKRVSAFIENIGSHFERSCDGSNAEPYAVLGHGDYWLNNMLFNYKEDSTEPTDLYFLDFQLSRYASPAVDIAYNLFCSGTHELRKNHFDQLLEIYYESLSSYLSELGSDPQRMFPYQALLSQLENFSVYSGGMALIVIPLFTNQGHEDNQLRPDNSDLPQLKDRINKDHLLKNTFRNCFKDLIDWNYI